VITAFGELFWLLAATGLVVLVGILLWTEAMRSRLKGFNELRRYRLAASKTKTELQAEETKQLERLEKLIDRNEVYLTKMNRRAGTAVPIIAMVVIAFGLLGLLLYWYGIQKVPGATTFPMPTPLSPADGIKVTASMRDTIEAGNSTPLTLSIAASGKACAHADSGLFVPTLLVSPDQFGASIVAKDSPATCKTTWDWIVAPKTPGLATLSFAISPAKGNIAVTHEFKGPLVSVNVIPSLSLQTWLPWLAAILGAAVTLLSSFGSLFKTDGSGDNAAGQTNQS
jgi:hypothetical protein